MGVSATNSPEKDWLAELAPVAAAFSVSGPVVSAGPFGNGHINETYVLTCEARAVRRRYVLQKINHRVFNNVPALMENIARVTAHVSARCFPSTPAHY